MTAPHADRDRSTPWLDDLEGVDWKARAQAAEAKVARVEALVDEWDGEVGAMEDSQPAGEIRVLKACLADLCTALAGPETTEGGE